MGKLNLYSIFISFFTLVLHQRRYHVTALEQRNGFQPSLKDIIKDTTNEATILTPLRTYKPNIGWFNQDFDHFSFQSNTTFDQKYLYYDKFWRENGPMFVYFGNEGEIEAYYDNSGAIFELAQNFGALVVFLEHRYYGKRFPFMNDLSKLTIEQALADMASFLSAKKVVFMQCRAKSACKVVLFGGSYGGVLNAWFRFKYPHLCSGALASSAPIDLFPGNSKAYEFMDAVFYTFRRYGSFKCAEKLKRGIQMINTDSTKKWTLLSKSFNTCRRINSPVDIRKLLFFVKGGLATLATFDYPYEANLMVNLPANPVNVACNRSKNVTDGVLAIKSALDLLIKHDNCYNLDYELLSARTQSSFAHALNSDAKESIILQWNYQVCSELILEPLTTNGQGFVVEEDSDIDNVVMACKRKYKGIVPRPFWLLKSFGNSRQLTRHTTNLLFTDGDKDPWRIGSIPLNVTSPDGSVFRILIEGAAHHQDLRSRNKEDSASLTHARELIEVNIKRWISLRAPKASILINKSQD